MNSNSLYMVDSDRIPSTPEVRGMKFQLILSVVMLSLGQSISVNNFPVTWKDCLQVLCSLFTLVSAMTKHAD